MSSRLKQSALFHDSFWAVFGNGLGYAMLLLAGVLIARLLGRDLYGEYGVAKTNMLYIAGFATFGMGFTSTKFIAQSQEQDRAHLSSLIRDAQLISFLFSLCVALLVAVFARLLATYLEEPGLTLCFRMLSLIIVAKSFCTTQTGILSGLKRFQDIAVNSMISGGAMLLLCVVLTYWFGLAGALTSLLLSQVVNVLANAVSIRRVERTFGPQSAVNRRLELVRFSFPIALQESSFSLCNWLAILLLTKYSSVGEVGLYTASAQWNAIITIKNSYDKSCGFTAIVGFINNLYRVEWRMQQLDIIETKTFHAVSAADILAKIKSSDAVKKMHDEGVDSVLCESLADLKSIKLANRWLVYLLVKYYRLCDSDGRIQEKGLNYILEILKKNNRMNDYVSGDELLGVLLSASSGFPGLLNSSMDFSSNPDAVSGWVQELKMQKLDDDNIKGYIGSHIIKSVDGYFSKSSDSYMFGDLIPA